MPHIFHVSLFIFLAQLADHCLYRAKQHRPLFTRRGLRILPRPTSNLQYENTDQNVGRICAIGLHRRCPANHGFLYKPLPHWSKPVSPQRCSCNCIAGCFIRGDSGRRRLWWRNVCVVVRMGKSDKKKTIN